MRSKCICKRRERVPFLGPPRDLGASRGRLVCVVLNPHDLITGFESHMYQSTNAICHPNKARAICQYAVEFFGAIQFISKVDLVDQGFKINFVDCTGNFKSVKSVHNKKFYFQNPNIIFLLHHMVFHI